MVVLLQGDPRFDSRYAGDAHQHAGRGAGKVGGGAADPPAHVRGRGHIRPHQVQAQAEGALSGDPPLGHQVIL